MASNPLRKPQEQILTKIEKNNKRAEIYIGKAYKEALDKVRAEMMRLYELYAEEGELTYAEMTRYNRLNQLEIYIKELITEAANKSIKTIDKLKSADYDAAYFGYSWSVDSAFGVKLDWGIFNGEIIKRISSYKNGNELFETPLEKIAKERLKKDGIVKIRRAITQGLISGESINKMSARIKTAINGSYYDAVRIATTEAHRVTEQGIQDQYDQAKENGIEIRKQLLATLDDRTREQSADMDLQISDEDGRFEYPDGNYYYPGNTGNPAWDINDRERSIEIVQNVEPLIRRSKEEGLTKYQPFKEWAKERGLKKSRYGEAYFD